MTECDRIRADAPGLAALSPGDPERADALAHARGCAGCARSLREAERLQSLVLAWEPPPLPADALERASREIRASLRREARRRLVAAVVAICASALVFVAFGRSRSRSALDWALAASLWALAVLVAGTASRRPLLATALAVVAALGAAAITGGPGPVAAALGLECLATEVAAAAFVAGAAWLAVRGGASAAPPAFIVPAAGAGALAGAAALQVTCAAHASLPHLLAFHVGGVALAAACATALRRRARPAPATTS